MDLFGYKFGLIWIMTGENCSKYSSINKTMQNIGAENRISESKIWLENSRAYVIQVHSNQSGSNKPMNKKQKFED